MKLAGDGPAPSAAAQPTLERAPVDRDAALAAAAAWSQGRTLIDPRRQRFGVLLVAGGLVLMAGGAWLVVFAG